MKNRIDKITVMHVVENLEVGGMENGVVNIANTIDKERFRFLICCISHHGVLSKRIQDENTLVVPLGWTGGFCPKLILKLAKIFKDNTVDIIHTHGWVTLIYCSVAAWIGGNKVLIHGEHGVFHLDNHRRKIAYRFISSYVDKYITVSYSLEKELVSLINSGKAKITTIPNGVDLQKFTSLSVADICDIKADLGIPLLSKVIGSAGRLELIKNYEMLIYVFSKLFCYVDMHCVLIGDGSQRTKLEEIAKQLGVGEKVHFTGKVDNPHQVMSVLDIFVCSSFSEGMSNTILEAMACGKPIVATNVGDNGKLVDDGYNGFLVLSEDASGLEKALKLLITDKEMLLKFGACSRKIAEEKYDILKMVSSYQDIYIQSIAAKRGDHDL